MDLQSRCALSWKWWTRSAHARRDYTVEAVCGTSGRLGAGRASVVGQVRSSSANFRPA